MSQNPKVDYLKGNFYEKIGKSELAVEKFREAAESGYERAQLILGQLYDSQGEIERQKTGIGLPLIMVLIMQHLT